MNKKFVKKLLKSLIVSLFLLTPGFLIYAQDTGFIITGATVTFTNYVVFDISGSIILQNGQLDAGSSNIRFTRQWVNSSPQNFVCGTSTVTLYDVLSSTITGSTTFYSLICQTGNKQIYFEGKSTTTILQNLVFDGLAETTRIVLRSTSTGVGWFLYLAPQSTHTVQFVDVANSTATGKTVYAYNSVDSGGNVNWIFVGANQPPYPPKDLAMYSPSWQAIPWGSWINYQQIIATFTLTDPNSTDTLQFNIQFSSYSDFSYLFINSTQPATATLPNNSATNYITTLLPEGTWYWRVNCTDNWGLSSPYSSGTIVNGRHFGIDITSPTQINDLTVSAITDQNHSGVMLTWTVPSDLSGIQKYWIARSSVSAVTSTNFGDSLHPVISTYTGSPPYYDTTTLPKTTYYYAIRAIDNAGNVSVVSNSPSVRTVIRRIDGDISDWGTSLPQQVNTSTTTVLPTGEVEWVWRDKDWDERQDWDFGDDAEMDLREIRITADENYIYFLIKLANIITSTNVLVGISIDTNSVVGTGLGDGVTFNADDSGMSAGGEYGYFGVPESIAKTYHFAERVIMFLSTSTTLTPCIMLRAWDGTDWYYPPTSPGPGGNFLNATNDTIEMKISRVDLGLTGIKTARISVAIYANAAVNPNAGDSTLNFNFGDALDSMSIARISTGSASGQYYNDPAWSMNSFDEDISDSDLDFFADIRLSATGVLPNTPPNAVSTKLIPDTTNTLTPTLIWQGVTDAEDGGAVSYLLEFDTTDTKLSGTLDPTYGFRVNVSTNRFTIPVPLKNLSTYYWRVWTRDYCGTLSNPSPVFTVYIDTTPPAKITDLTLTKVTTQMNTPIDLLWTPISNPYGISKYRIYRSSVSEITDVNKGDPLHPLIDETVSPPYRDNTTQFNTVYWYAVTAVNGLGTEGPVSNSPSQRTARCSIDGFWTDWSTSTVFYSIYSYSASTVVANGVANQSEFIFVDKSGEQRNDPNGPNNNADFDIRAVNICADDTHIYFLVRLRDISASTMTYIAIGIDTDTVSGSGLNILGDDTGMTYGDKENDTYGSARANPERMIIVHSTSATSTPIIELYASDGTSWYAPPTSPGMYATYLRADYGTDQDGIEFKISREDLGLVGNKTARITVGSFHAVLNWANDADTTVNYLSCDAIDTISIIRLSTGSLAGQYYNDQTWSYSSWGEDISDGDIDFWFDVRISADGTISNTPPPIITSNLLPSPTNTLTPTLLWGAVSDSDPGDAVTSYLVEFDSQTNLSGNLTSTYGYRVNVPSNYFQIPTALKNLTTYYWRVWSRDRCGSLSTSASLWTVFIDTGPPPTVSLLSPADASSVNLPVTLDWTDAVDDSGWAVSYQVQVDSDTSFSPPELDVIVSTSTYTITSLPPGTHYWRVRVKDAAGNYSAWSTVRSFNILVQKVVDGDPSDWVGIPITATYPTRRYQATVSAGEWIWTDALYDNRDSTVHYAPENYDIQEVRVAADTNYIYFLIKVRDMTYTDLAQFAIGIDTNIVSGVGFDWIGDDAETALGGATWASDTAEYPETASQATFSGYKPFAETIVIFHNTNKPTGTDQTQGDEYWVEYWSGRDLDGDGIINEWEGVAGSSAVFSPANNCIEARIPRSAVGLVGATRARFTFAIFESSPSARVAWANVQDTTKDDYGSDASDCVSIMRPALPTATSSEIIDRNEPIFGSSVKSNKWWKELSDQAIDFWVQIPFTADGIVTNNPPNPPTLLSPANGSTIVGNLTPTFDWNDPTDPDTNDAVTSYMIEIGKTPNLDGTVDWRVNLTSSVFTVPSPGLDPGTTYYWRVWSRDRCGVMTPSSIWTVFISSITGIANIPPFTPVIDGIKDPGWGTTPTYTSPQAMAPVDAGLNDGSTAGIQREVYVTNDAANLYIGFWTVGDVWGGNKASAVYGIALETLRNTGGGGYDPWRSHEDVSWVYKPDFWVNGVIGDGAENFSLVNLYQYNPNSDGQWLSPEVLVPNEDYAAKAKTYRWAEFKLPLKKLGLKKDNVVMMFLTGIPDATGTNEGQSYSDTIPFDTGATSAYGLYFDTHTITQYFQYRIQYSTVPATHIPNSEPVAGWGKMRSPLTPTSTDTVKIMVQITPSGIFDSGYVYYSTNNWTTTNSVPLGSVQTSGGSDYLWATIPKFPRGTVVKYYIGVEANGMYTYLYGTDTTSNRTPDRTTAQTNAYSYTVGNAGPSAPTVVTLTPELPDDYSVLSSTASGAVDPDGDTLVYQFEWYRNNVLYASGVDTTVEFSTTVPPTATFPGDQWYIRWRSSDTYGAVSDWVYSSTRTILGRNWLGVTPDKINTSTISVSEFIWRDKINDTTDGNFDLTEARIYADSTYIWFLFKLRDITSKDLPFIAVTIDTDTVSGSGSLTVGDDSNIILGNDYPPAAGLSPPYQEPRWEKQIVFHSTAPGQFTAEITTSPAGVWSTPSSGYFVNCFPETDIIEARIPRADLWLVGVSTARITISVFKNNIGPAQTVDTTATDALDSASIVRISTGSLLGQYYNDRDNTMNAYTEELSDNDIDFWLQLRLSASSIVGNTNPPAPTSPSPPNGTSTTTLRPTLSWLQSADVDPQDAVTSWLVQISDTLVGGELGIPYVYQVNVTTNFWTIPENLAGGVTYYWRVSARDRYGYLTPSPIWSFYTTVKEPVIVKVYDSHSPDNKDNFGLVTGIEDADGTVTWDWDPVEPGCTYYIDISSHPDFVPGSFYVTNFSTTSTYFTATGLTRGKYFYARVKAKNPAGIEGPYTYSDGIYINRIQIDSSNTDWQPIPNITIVNSTGLANGIGYFRDRTGSPDTRTDSPVWQALDLSTFAVVCDEYNLYLYFKFETPAGQPFDGIHFIQVAVDNDQTSSERVFIGRLVPSEDTYVAGEVPWEYLIRIRSGDDDVYRVDPTWSSASWQPGVYSENIDGRFFEVMMPLEKLGGKDKFLGKTVNFTVAIASRTLDGNISQWGVNNSNMVDVISSTDTWQEVGVDNPQVIDCYLATTFNLDGTVKSIELKRSVTNYAPTPEPTYSAPPEARGFILYNVFTDVFLDGDPSNNNILDKESAGGDFQGIISTISYFNELGVTHIYLSPVHKFEWGRWGYLADDHFDVSNKFGGLNKFIELNKIARRHNLSVMIDWVCGQISEGGRTRKNHPEVWDKTQIVFGGNPLQHRLADARDLYANNMLWWLSFGPTAARIDNPKFWPNDDGNQYFFWQFCRRRWDRYVPNLYTMGEIPGDAGVLAPYCQYGDQLSGAQDFDTGHYGTDIWGQTYQWAYGSLAEGTYINNLTGIENAYGPKAIAAFTLENHDQPRFFNMIYDSQGVQDGIYDYDVSPYSDYYADAQVPHTSWGKYQVGYYMNLTHTEASCLFYGCEWGFDGGNFYAWSAGDNAVTKQNMKPGGTTDPMPWGGNTTPQWKGARTSPGLRASFLRVIHAKAIFDAFKSSPFEGGRYWTSPDGTWSDASADLLSFERRYGSQRVVVAINRNTRVAQILTLAAGSGIWRNWMDDVTYDATTAAQNVLVNPSYIAIMVKGGYYLSTLSGTALPGAIIDVDGKSVWTTKADANGNYSISRIVSFSGGTTRKVRAWAPGKNIVETYITFPAADGTVTWNPTFTDDTTPPAAPVGLVGEPKDRGVMLTWTKNTEPDVESYLIYRSTRPIPDDSWPTPIAEVLNNFYFDNNRDGWDYNGDGQPDWLENGTTYYYRIRAVDRNGNKSALSNQIAVVPGKIKVRFWLDARNVSPIPIVAYIAGNAKALGAQEDGFKWNPQQMISHGDGTFEYIAELPAGMLIEYKYLINDLNTWEFGAGNNRGRHIPDPGVYSGYRQTFEIYDQTGNKEMTTVNVWNVYGDEYCDTAPRFPEGLTLTPSDKTLRLGWTKNKEPDMAYYTIYRSTWSSTAGFVAIAKVDAETVSYVDTGLINGNTYYYKMTATDKKGYTSAESVIVYSYPRVVDTTPPSVPTGLKAYALSSTSVKIVWNANNEPDIAGYNIYRDGVKLNPTLIPPSANPYYIDTNVTVHTTYYYQIQAVDSSGNTSNLSSSLPVHIVFVTFKVDMGNINPTNVQIYGSPEPLDSIGSNNLVKVGTTKFYQITLPFVSNTVVRYRYAYNNMSVKEQDFPTTVDREYIVGFLDETVVNDWEEAPDSPSDPKAYAGINSAYLYWSEVTTAEDLAGYNIYYSTTGAIDSFKKVNTDIVLESPYKVTGLTNGITYYFIIRAVDSGEIMLESKNSAIVLCVPEDPVYVNFGCPYVVGSASSTWADPTKIKLKIAIQSGAGPDAVAVWNTPDRANITEGTKEMTSVGSSAWRITVPLPRGNKFNFLFFAETTGSPPEGLQPYTQYYDCVPNTGTILVSLSSSSISQPVGTYAYFAAVGPNFDARRVLELGPTLTPGTTIYVFCNFASSPTAPAYVQAYPGNGKVTLYWSAPYGEAWTDIINNVPIGGVGESFKAADVVCGGVYQIYMSTWNAPSITQWVSTATVPGNVFSITFSGLTNGITYYYVIRASDTFRGVFEPNHYSVFSTTVSVCPKNVHIIAKIRVNRGAKEPFKSMRKTIAIQEGITVSAWLDRSNMTPSGKAEPLVPPPDDSTELEYSCTLIPGTTYNFILFAYSTFPITGLQVGTTYYDTVPNDNTAAGMVVTLSTSTLNIPSGIKVWCGSVGATGDARRFIGIVDTFPSGTTVYIYCNFASSPTTIVAVAQPKDEKSIELWWTPYGSWGSSGESFKAVDVIAGGWYYIYRSTQAEYGPYTLWLSTSGNINYYLDDDRYTPGDNLGLESGVWYYYVILSSDVYTGNFIPNMFYPPEPPRFSTAHAVSACAYKVPTYLKVENKDVFFDKKYCFVKVYLPKK